MKPVSNVDTYNYRDLGNWTYQGPREMVVKMIQGFGPPDHVEKSPETGTAKSVSFFDVDGFDIVRIVDSNANKLHPYLSKIYVEGSLYFTVPAPLIGPLKEASATIMIDELNQLVTGRCASLSMCAVTLNFVVDVVNGITPLTRQEYDRRIKRVIDDGVIDPAVPWWKDELNEMSTKFYSNGLLSEKEIEKVKEEIAMSRKETNILESLKTKLDHLHARISRIESALEMKEPNREPDFIDEVDDESGDEPQDESHVFRLSDDILEISIEDDEIDDTLEIKVEGVSVTGIAEEHEHEDGTVHSHSHDGPHTHDNEEMEVEVTIEEDKEDG